MAPKKLSEADKKDILALYRETDETTSTIAGRYGVSNTTISRILKQSLSDDEYEGLIQQKRAGGIARHQAELESDSEFDEELSEGVDDDEPSVIPLIVAVQEPSPPPVGPKTATPYRRQRRRSSLMSSLETEAVVQPDLPLMEVEPSEPEQQATLEREEPDVEDISLPYDAGGYESESPSLSEALHSESEVMEEILGEEILDPEEDFEDDLEDEDDLDNEEDLDDDYDPAADDLTPVTAVHLSLVEAIEILPLSEATIPKTFYLVVDRASELITRPLKDFADLGQIPDEEIQEKTLPIFDNHRVAKRFLRRMQRVIKVPDGKMLQKASPYLQAKGITRLLIDGRIYSLSTDL